MQWHRREKRVKGVRLEKRLKDWTRRPLTKARTPHLGFQRINCAAEITWAIIRGLRSMLPLATALVQCLWVVSAGYGLIRSNERLVPYSATFTPWSHGGLSGGETWGSCLSAATNGGMVLAAPGNVLLGCDLLRSSDLRPCSPTRPLLIALSAEYFSTLEDDLFAARKEVTDPDRLIIVSAGGRKGRTPGNVNLLPCDARLENLLGGVRAFAQCAGL